MECFGTTDFDNNSPLITLSAIIISGLQCIRMDLQEVGGGCGDWMELAQDRERWRALVSTVMNSRVP
jgi:hypothetical protein